MKTEKVKMTNSMESVEDSSGHNKSENKFEKFARVAKELSEYGVKEGNLYTGIIELSYIQSSPVEERAEVFMETVLNDVMDGKEFNEGVDDVMTALDIIQKSRYIDDEVREKINTILDPDSIGVEDSSIESGFGMG